MAEQITKKTRHLQKHDVEANWLKAVNFKPMPGEIIVYDKDEQHDFVRTKIGDGETYINDLPFINNAIIDVVSLPTEYINYEAIYRVIDTVVYDYGDPLYDPKIHYVDALPEEGEGVINFDTDDLCFYYNDSDGLVYCYIDEILSAAAGAEGIDLPIGWYPYNALSDLMSGIGTMVLNVYALPEQGMPAMNLDTGDSWVYYHIGENEVYCYIDETLSQFINNQFGMTIPIGWYPYSQLSSFADVNYQGIFTKEKDIPDEGFSILIKYELYTYNSDWRQVGGTQVQSDWEQYDETQPDFIRNKPLEQGKIRPSLLYQPDWNIVDESNPAVIKNKPFGIIPAGTIAYQGYVDCIGYNDGDVPITQGTVQGAIEYFTDGYYTIIFNNKIYTPYDTGLWVNTGFELGSTDLLIRGQTLNGSYPLVVKYREDYIVKLNSQFLNLDSTPLENSNNPITSDAVYSLNQLVNTVGTKAANLSDSLSYNIVPRLEQLENNTIPIVTTSDNGKFLQVVNGAWTAVSITNGNEVAY